MKKLLLILLLFSNITYSQKVLKVVGKDLASLQKQTVYIMKKLKIKIKENVSKDTIAIRVDSTKKYFNAYYLRNAIWRVDTAFYIIPTISVSPLIYDVFNKVKHYDTLILLSAIGAIVHELTHHLQKTSGDSLYVHGTKDEQKYITQPIEFEAWSVSSYYFWWFYDKKKIYEIMKDNGDTTSKRLKLINAFRHIWAPSHPDIF